MHVGAQDVCVGQEGVNRESKGMLCVASVHLERVFLGGSPVSFAVPS